MPWFHGNLHCHSTRSDGDSPPEAVARFYRDHGFAFVAVTDHNQRTGPEHCGAAVPGFAVLPACEYSAEAEGRPAHVNGIGVTAVVAPSPQPPDVRSALQEALDGFRAQGAFTILNHPNWRWSFGGRELLGLRGAQAIEVWNGARDSDNRGDADHPPTEALWDAALGAGQRLWAVASDDCHHFGARRSWRSEPPFSGWVAVEAERPEPDLLIAALAAGRFYASAGPRLERIVLARDLVEVVAAPRGSACRIVFIGAGGRDLAAVSGTAACYRPRGDEGYVRCRVEDGMGLCAWTQPLFLA